METCQFKGWKKCIELKSGKLRLIITTEVGPRIIGVFYGDSDNLVYVDPETAGNTKNSKEWHIYGGHRIWHSPEAMPRTYVTDNTPIEVKKTKDGLCFSSGLEHPTGISKSFTIKKMKGNKFAITHKIRNDNMWDIELAAWALTVMAPGGTAIIPQPQGNKKSLLPNRYLIIWPYTNMADKRYTWGDKYILVKQDVNAKTPCKFGINGEDGWLAYVNNGVALKKSFKHFTNAEYPDNGCSIEVYSCNFMLEIETLSPLYLLAPGEEITHIEEWEAMPADQVPGSNLI